jgi:hypothetical protein
LNRRPNFIPPAMSIEPHPSHSDNSASIAFGILKPRKNSQKGKRIISNSEDGYMAVCDRMAGKDFFLAILYHEWFVIERSAVLEG